MSLTSSLYSGTSGLSNTGNALQVTSNNISNINTIGFKKGTATFADTLYQSIGTNGGSSQVGLGMNIDSVSQVFTDGSLESSSNSTDLAIGGNGFFVVSEQGSDLTYYTRAGNFSFDESGALSTSSGYILQGWNVDPATGEEYGAINDLIVTDYTCPPDETEEAILIVNLDSDAESFSNVLSNAFKYDEENGTTVAAGDYEYQSVLTVYDALGGAHEVTAYFDKVSDTKWEYIITCDPDEDNRNNVAALESAGLLARGTVTFSENSGDIISMTMEEYTGQIGNVDISGNNTIDMVNFEIQDTVAMQSDGYGFSMTYDNDDGWMWDSRPAAYATAEIDPDLSDENNIYIVLDGEDEADLIISLDEDAQAGDTLSFNINKPMGCNIQKVENIDPGGDTYDNTTLSINDPSAMTVDEDGLGIIWNPNTETWSWSNPQIADAAGTLVSDGGGIGTYTTTNADAMTMVAEDVSLYWTGTEWDWNEDLKDDDIINIDASLIESDTSPDVAVTAAGSEGAGILAGDYEVTWDGSAWSVSNSPAGLTATVAGTADGYELTIYETDAANPSTIEISLDDPMTATVGQTMTFTIDPTPPDEYVDATILASDADSVSISFNNDADEDLLIEGLTGQTNFSFDVRPDVAPTEYENATLKGDETYVAIDLDGSGDEDGEDQDILFTFEEDLTVASTITFDIAGSTAWREVATDEAKDTGYMQFKVDFLGGEAGSTETGISFNIGTSWDGSNWVNDSLSSTQYARSSSTTYRDADGYASGDLQGVEVDANGLITGTYSNGQTMALFLVALADFNNNNGLDNVGQNLYAATTESGAAVTNKAGQNGLGSIASYSLESSNVDISEEFVSMIELQNAYEANAKIISTVDDMMSTVIGMKR